VAAVERFGSGDRQDGVDDDELTMGRPVWTMHPGMSFRWRLAAVLVTRHTVALEWSPGCPEHPSRLD